MKMKRLLAAFLLIACLASLLSGCESGQQGSAGAAFTPSLDTGTKQTILVVGMFDNFESLDAAGLAFQQYYPNVNIEYEKLDSYEKI